MKPTVLVVGTLDTKLPECQLLASKLKLFGCQPMIMDCGILGSSPEEADIANEDVASAAGESLQSLRHQSDRAHAVNCMGEGAAKIASRLYAEGAVHGILGFGGSGGTTIASQAMRALPLGVPKLVVSTVASGNVAGYVGTKDVIILHSVVDLAGLNSVLRPILLNAAAAMAGMVRARHTDCQGATSDPIRSVKPARRVVAMTMFGVTTPAVQMSKEVLESLGYEVVVFHANGTGGRCMQEMAIEGTFAGILDMTTTELADEHLGGMLGAGPDRLRFAGRLKLPHLIVPGALDMVNFGGQESVPEAFRGRLFHHHNAGVTLMRTTAEENTLLGTEIGKILNAFPLTTRCLIPTGGFSAIDKPSGPFYSPEHTAAFLSGLQKTVGDKSLVETVDLHINDAEFGRMAALSFHSLLREVVK